MRSPPGRQRRRLRQHHGHVHNTSPLLNDPLAAGLEINGELVLWRDGRLDFAALQQRLHPAASRADGLARSMPVSYVIFDLLEVAGADLRRRPYLERRVCLEDLLGR